MALIEKLTAVADAIRGKTGGTEKLTLDQMATEIEVIESDKLTHFLDGSLLEINTNATILRNYAFYYSAITSINGPNVTQTGSYCFQYSSKLKTVYLPVLSKAAARSFQDCKALEEISLPGITDETIHSGLFINCKALINVSLPNMHYVKSEMFLGCSVLPSLDLPAVVQIDSKAFSSCTVLNRLILRSNSLVSLGGVNAFEKSPFASGGTGGTVYVPSALVESYKTATNWSTLYAAGTCNFVAIEGSEYE